MDDGLPRRQLHGYVSIEAREGWYRFADAHHTNVTALLEAVGLALGRLAPSDTLPPVLRAAVKEAQTVAGARSSRRRKE